jgi:hypothetical protein
MDDEVKEKKKDTFKKAWGFWATITDLESAVEAAKSAQIVAYYLVFSYGVQIAFLYGSGSSLFGTVPEDKIDLYITYAMYGIIAVLFLWLGLRIRKEKLGAVPYVAGWMLFEIVVKTIMAPGKGIIVSIIFGLVAISGFRGWLGVKKYRKIDLTTS